MQKYKILDCRPQWHLNRITLFWNVKSSSTQTKSLVFVYYCQINGFFCFPLHQPFHLPHLALPESVDADLAPVGVEGDGGEAGKWIQIVFNHLTTYNKS